jgi:SnoaL-like domain
MRSLKGSALCFGLLCVALLLVSCQAALMPAPTPTAVPPPPTAALDLDAPLKAWADAINKGDVDAALGLLADDPTWSAPMMGMAWVGGASGKERVRAAFDQLAGMEASLGVKDCQPQDDRMVCAVNVAEGCIVAFGEPDGLTGKLMFIYQPDSRAREVSITLDDPKLRDYTKFFAAEEAWVLQNRSEHSAKQYERSREGGSVAAKLCREYAETLK